jgi:hypothetical protein
MKNTLLVLLTLMSTWPSFGQEVITARRRAASGGTTVTFDNSSSCSTTVGSCVVTGTSASFTYTLGSITNGGAYVGLGFVGGGTSAWACTFNLVAMTEIDDEGAGTAVVFAIPTGSASGVKAVSCTWTGSIGSPVLIVVSYANVNQSTMLSQSPSDGSGPSSGPISPGAPVSSGTGNRVISIAVSDHTLGTADGNQLQNIGGAVGMEDFTGSSSVLPAWPISGALVSNWATIAVNIPHA